LFPAAGQQLFFVNAPSWKRAHIVVGSVGLTIETTGFVEPDAGGTAQYVQSVTLDDEPLDRSWITAAELRRGGRLHIELGPDRSPWATSSRPPSVSRPTELHGTRPLHQETSS
jgi:putative alpha-1,2-mannosidase